ncbi:GNAT family N-acetyltransferase [Deinococcus hopiensis]|uniref:Acetyltransferase (GNAT) family protein n=1 Tax=Deinococcus hopiensis KR-140 TaxID=695939 RepID=A0A1W1VWJ0_9DEIO|nr:GNAT family N-acetyltransferase [Deinococcus hopiensis]SMB97737.1 Acetyltransferase (GNAT) family protein [Deinococcus hopiensis KR-140]
MNGDLPNVRGVERRDLARVVELCGDHAAFERAAYDPAGKQERLEQALFGEVPRLHAWVAEQDGDLIGYATATLDYATWDAAPFVHLDCLYLRPQARGQGVGLLLLAEVLALGKRAGCVNAQWQTPQWNEDAIRFYRRQGAVGYSKCRFILPLRSYRSPVDGPV